MVAFGGLQKVADTGMAGFVLQNGTPNILSYTVPNDGNMHRVTVISEQRVTVAETGGAITLTFNLPDGSATNRTPYAGGSGVGNVTNDLDLLVQAGSTVTLAQSSALTLGAAIIWAQIWSN